MHKFVIVLATQESHERIEKEVEWPVIPATGDMVEVAPCFVVSHYPVAEVRHTFSSSRIEVLFEPLSEGVFARLRDSRQGYRLQI